MAPLSSKQAAVAQSPWQRWLIEDTWDGHIQLEARLVKSWRGICGTYKVLEGVDGRYYFWAVLKTSDGPGVLQRLVSFPDAETMSLELDFGDWCSWADQAAVTWCH